MILQKKDGEILTPDGQQILVGATESDVLVYEEGFNNWHTKPKPASEIAKVRLLTPDGRQILVGEHQNEVLILQPAMPIDTWRLKTKT